jgi:hypothetical protein
VRGTGHKYRTWAYAWLDFLSAARMPDSIDLECACNVNLMKVGLSGPDSSHRAYNRPLGNTRTTPIVPPGRVHSDQALCIPRLTIEHCRGMPLDPAEQSSGHGVMPMGLGDTMDVYRLSVGCGVLWLLAETSFARCFART